MLLLFCMLRIFGLTINNWSLAETVGQIKSWLTKSEQRLMVTANPEILLKARNDAAYHRLINQAALRVADGVGVILISYLFGKPLHHGRVRGVDLVEKLLSDSQLAGYKVFLVGGSETGLSEVARHYGIGISYAVGPQFSDWQELPLNDRANDELINKINQANPDLLLVGFGAPKQERWLSYYLPQLPSVRAGIGVGGSFDYLGGRVRRAPLVMQLLGLEWLWRLILQPGRIVRIINAAIIFPILAIFDQFKQLFHVE